MEKEGECEPVREKDLHLSSNSVCLHSTHLGYNAPALTCHDVMPTPPPLRLHIEDNRHAACMVYFIYGVEEEEEEEEDEGGGNNNSGRQRLYVLACIEDLKHGHPDGYLQGLRRIAAVPAAVASNRGASQQIIDADTIEALTRVVYKGKEASFIARNSCSLG